MKHIEVSVPGSTYLIDIKGEDLKIIDGKAKLIVTDGNETIAVFSGFYYWREVGRDTKDNDGYTPDKDVQDKLIEPKKNHVDINVAPCPEGPEPETPGRRRIQELSRKHRKPDTEPKTPE